MSSAAGRSSTQRASQRILTLFDFGGEHTTRTNVRAHERHKPGTVFATVHVKAHIREVGTQGATRRHMDRRSKRARACDNAVRAKRVGRIKNAHDRKDWTAHPGEMDLAGIDSDGHR